MDETTTVTGGNFGTIRETDEVVVTIRTELAVEQFASGDFEGLNTLSCLYENQKLFFFFWHPRRLRAKR